MSSRKKKSLTIWTQCGLGQEPAGSYAHGNEHLGCLERKYFLYQLSDCYPLKNASAPCSYSVMKYLLLVIGSFSAHFIPSLLVSVQCNVGV